MSQTQLKDTSWLDARTRISIVRRRVTQPVSMHLHEYFELEIVLSGAGTQNLNGSVYPLHPGTVYFLTPIDFHAVEPEGALEVLNVAFAQDLLSPQLQTHFLNRREDLIFSSPQEAQSLATLIGRLEQECACDDAFSQTARRQLLELIMYPIARSAGTQPDLPRPDVQSLQEALQYLFRHFREDITLADLAERSGYTPNYFSRIFHESCGIRFVDFLSRLRLNYAQTMLLTTSQPVAAIARTSGFSSPSNFFRAFRAETGRSPLEYRRQKQSKGE